jgi:hypothetical protein
VVVRKLEGALPETQSLSWTFAFPIVENNLKYTNWRKPAASLDSAFASVAQQLDRTVPIQCIDSIVCKSRDQLDRVPHALETNAPVFAR